MTSITSDHALGPHFAVLAERADRAGLLDVAYRTVDTPVGRLLLAATPAGLVRVAYEREDLDRVLGTLAVNISPRILEAPRRLDQAARQLDEYFAHQRHAFDLPVDLRLVTGFRRQVLGYLQQVGYGHAASYASVAAAVGHPRAFRAVGRACSTNPVPLVVPCHRVIRSDGALNGYVGGPEIKRHLLEMEAAA
ncbi:MAG TPA: methylated-DNA--[protein]-cysteine S-methyltransferase [Acidimicrobiales bacterium]|nr:methylated-DNA--[protein]-cysteine S-methyltransferase [Acidimicrobiales bacterium]